MFRVHKYKEAKGIVILKKDQQLALLVPVNWGLKLKTFMENNIFAVTVLNFASELCPSNPQPPGVFFERSSICFCIAAITCSVDFWVGGLKLYAMRMLILCSRRWCHHVKCFGFYFFNDMLYVNDNDLPHSLYVSCSSNMLFVI